MHVGHALWSKVGLHGCGGGDGVVVLLGSVVCDSDGNRAVLTLAD